MNNKLCLGTVQFGLDYGINNKRGKPIKEDVFEMLDTAIYRGIDIFDTAVAYGNAEELLGEYVCKRACKNKVNIISKLKPNLIDESCKNPEFIVEEEIKKSLTKMNIDILEGYLLHTPTNFYDKGIMEGLIRSKEKGLVKNIGVSIYEFEHALDVVKSGMVDYIQIPYSIFDQRMDNGEFFEKAKDNNVKVFARSAFLQGLILMNENDIPEHLEHVKRYLKIYDNIIKEYGISRVEGAIKFSYNNPNIDYLVFGVDNKEQLLQNIDISENLKVDDMCIKKIKEALVDIEKSIIFPSLWARR